MGDSTFSRLTRRRIAGGAAAGGGALALAACGAQTGAGDAKPQAARKSASLKVVARTNSEAEMWPIRLPAFEAAHPGLKAEAELHAGDIQEKIATLIASGTIGDVVHTHPSQAQPQRLFLGGSMKQLDTYAARDKLDLKQWYQAAIDSGRLDGKLISLPFKGKMATVAMHLNLTLFEQAGIKPPDLNTSLNDLADMATKLTRPDGSQWGIVGFMPDSARNVTGVIRRWNAELFDKDQKKATLDTAEARAAFAWYYDALHRRKFATLTDDEKLFREGKAAMLIHRDFNSKTSYWPAAQSQGFKYSATLIPKGPTGRRGGVWIPDAMQLSSTSPNPDEAWLLLKWLTDHDTGLALALQKTGSTTPGARPDVYNDPKFLNHETFPRLFQELDRDSNALAENYQGSIPHNYKIPEVNAVLNKAMTAVRNNEAEPTPAFLKNLNDEVQNILSLPR
jgi:multiple sugar transport system substrate-binding protein